MTHLLLPALIASFVIADLTPAHAQSSVGASDSVVNVNLLEGWRETDGRHIAAIRVQLAPGWKTYWRAPGDGGLPTVLQWSQSKNIDDLRILWPRPTVFDEGGMRSLGYTGEVVLPLELTPISSGDITLDATLSFGVCKEVCVPVVVDLKQIMQTENLDGASVIRSAMAAVPKAPDQAGLHSVSCTIERTEKGHVVSVNVIGDVVGQSRAMTLETNDAEVWVGRTELTSDGRNWHGVTHIFDHRDTRAAIVPGDLRITLLTDDAAVDIQGCKLR